MELLIISGQSGAGKSRVADILEDMSYYRVDNMPAALLTRFAELSLAAGGRYERVALVIDARERNGFDELFRALSELKALDCGFRILYVEADISAIIKRYKESRRPHPLAVESGSLEEAVERELALLQPVRARADYFIDTTSLTLGQLQKRIHSLFAGEKPAGHLTVKIVAFGFKYGLPMDADLVFDVRFLPNPYYLAELKDLSGLDGRVAAFVFRHSGTREFMTRLESLIEFLLPQYEEEGKRELTIAVGCTGGRHRSVAVAAHLSDFIHKQGHDARLITRDIDKDMSRDAGRG
jgi:UPF0042 nucleotide-binding protein